MRFLFCLVLALAACAPTTIEPSPAPGDGQPMPEFSLEDRNPSSGTYGQQISPRDHLAEVTAWYFSHVS